mmetsp:Transcript_8731/g.27852  ORF Transcript_8731/g.27852 Transcript_8731/m.27852 type:complete len:215 (+) Transcript_8731:726-1370(+)
MPRRAVGASRVAARRAAVPLGGGSDVRPIPPLRRSSQHGRKLAAALHGWGGADGGGRGRHRRRGHRRWAAAGCALVGAGGFVVLRVDADEQRVVHDVLCLQELCVDAQLLQQLAAHGWADEEAAATLRPVEVLEHRVRLAGRVEATKGGPLEVEPLVNVERAKDVVHDYKVTDVLLVRLDAVEAKEAGDEGVWVRLHVLVVLNEDVTEEQALVL